MSGSQDERLAKIAANNLPICIKMNTWEVFVFPHYQKSGGDPRYKYASTYGFEKSLHRTEPAGQNRL
jgi:hypothetical protein